MEGYDASTYGDKIADIYDELYEELFDVEGAVDLLTELARGGRVLELAIGTGRLAVPLAHKGIDIHGIDVSEKMVAKLRARPGGDAIPVTMGDFGDVPVEGTFNLVFIAFNTLFALPDQDAQVRCFHNVAAHLETGGTFVVEAFVPDPTRFDDHQRISVDEVKIDRVTLEVTRHDPVAQRSESHHLVIGEQGIRLYPVEVRYAWPAELDLMAQLAGLRLEHRWGDWRKAKFDSASKLHVSAYIKD